MSVANLMLPRQTVVLLMENKIKTPALIQVKVDGSSILLH